MKEKKIYASPLCDVTVLAAEDIISVSKLPGVASNELDWDDFGV